MTAHEIAIALGTHSKSETSWMVRCPSHPDKSPSMRLTDRDGKILVYCLAGCSGDEIISALKSEGLWPAATDEQKKIYLDNKRTVEKGRAMVYVAIFESQEGQKSKSEWAKYWIMRKILRMK